MHKQYKNFGLACLLVMLTGWWAQAQIRVPVPSPTVTLLQEIGLTKIELRYSRPGMKGRKIFGHLVPYGKVWRTGANQNTRLTFYEPVTIGGKKIPKGQYALHTIPGKIEWTIIINKKQGYGNRYDPTQDVHRFKVKPQRTKLVYETCTIDFSNFDKNSADLRIFWENTMVAFRIETEVDPKVMKQIKKVMDNPARTLAQAYYTSARYYFETGRDLNKALEWATQAAKLRPDAYWMLHYQAKIEGRLKKYTQAIATAKLSIAAAKVRKNPDFVRMNEALITKWKKLK
ncbi:DUF2911 domain-containing protein [Microscilla marina]|uniref:Uncharacterized protein n=1 Tax=Microscilla marina ATCC 23134 TaxID=313606 RepID=A1ZCC9_MICM2|nr:DUF2911 domain-containing protein [Microscilla marina]EAY31931.1 hypothetical protein M23134_01960 [Microscilla marina ATCC 23134]